MEVKKISVKVICGAKKSGVERVAQDKLVARLVSRPIKGRANKELISILADFLGVRKSQIRLVGGQRSRYKLIEIYY